MKLTLVLALTILPAAVRAADVSEVAFTRTDDSFRANSAGGEVRIQSRHSMLAVHLPDGTPRKCELVVLFDPASGQYLWNHTIAVEQQDTFPLEFASLLSGSSGNSALYVSADRITWFTFAAMELEVRQSSGQAQTLDAAYDAALASLRERWLDYFNSKIQATHTVAVWKLVDRAFFDDPEKPSPVYPAIETVTRSGSEWLLTIRARWKAQLTLDESFNPQGIKRIGE
jgi:hypothetical protein